MLKESGYSIRDACEALGVSRSSYYYAFREKVTYKERDEFRDEALLEKMKSLKADHPFWGVSSGMGLVEVSGRSSHQSEEGKEIDEGEWAHGESDHS